MRKIQWDIATVLCELRDLVLTDLPSNISQELQTQKVDSLIDALKAALEQNPVDKQDCIRRFLDVFFEGRPDLYTFEKPRKATRKFSDGEKRLWDLLSELMSFEGLYDCPKSTISQVQQIFERLHREYFITPGAYYLVEDLCVEIEFVSRLDHLDLDRFKRLRSALKGEIRKLSFNQSTCLGYSNPSDVLSDVSSLLKDIERFIAIKSIVIRGLPYWYGLPPRAGFQQTKL
ncbi:MAG: hypothetical protein RLN76_07385 [Phycisphaeraceae bacterium]